MATANFYIKNALNYYAIFDTYECENEEGEMQTYERDEWDWNELFNDIRYRGEICKNFPNFSKEWNAGMDARELCESNSNWATFGKAWTTETNVEGVIVYRCGYYEGVVLDYDIKLTTYDGTNFYLSEYDNIDDMIEDYLDNIEDIIKWQGHQHKWNVGTFKLQKKNIHKWLEKRIDDQIEKCEDFCKSNCEKTLGVCARFSNGETWYSEVR